MHRKILFIAAATIGSVTASGLADFFVEAVPTWRGDANTAYYSWDTFTQAGPSGVNYPSQGSSSPAGLTNHGVGAIIAGSGNLYGAGGALDIEVTATGSNIAEAVFNVATAGTQIDFSTVSLSLQIDGGPGYNEFIDGSTLALLNYQDSEPAPGPPGNFSYIDNISFTFDLSGYGNVTALSFDFKSETVNMSLTDFAMDLRFTPIPAPGALALFGLAGLAGRRRRRA